MLAAADTEEAAETGQETAPVALAVAAAAASEAEGDASVEH